MALTFSAGAPLALDKALERGKEKVVLHEPLPILLNCIVTCLDIHRRKAVALVEEGRISAVRLFYPR